MYDRSVLMEVSEMRQQYCLYPVSPCVKQPNGFVRMKYDSDVKFTPILGSQVEQHLPKNFNEKE